MDTPQPQILPRLRRLADSRSYDVLSPPDTLRVFLGALGFLHTPGKPTDLWLDKWTHGQGTAKTVLLLFASRDGRPPRLSLLGPRVPQVDAIVVEEVAG